MRHGRVILLKTKPLKWSLRLSTKTRGFPGESIVEGSTRVTILFQFIKSDMEDLRIDMIRETDANRNDWQ